ncbi:condensation domain-containing protein (plasmid) [Streptomyces sp. NBC_01351]|uniref:condensation domain-containing protein n=1 Tax=Streptomyces sp. NBC_01351 TaxID=2903833 RepID=UPI002E2F52C2|nr:condensation domain-containing protein [Streptomyces sp. NBC_01351]
MSAARQSFRTGTGPRPLPVPASPLQRDLLLDALERPGAGIHAGQLLVRWYGPLDAARFDAAWQTLHDADAALRTALADPAFADPAFVDPAFADPVGELPAMAVHPRVEPRIARQDPGGADWHTLVRSERLRAFDLRRPGQLRILLGQEGAPPGATRILLTYHHAFLDGRSVRGLLRAFLRAYLADGRPLGGERRPDVRDHARWLARQDTSAAREFWSRAAPPADAVTLPALPALPSATGADPVRSGHGWSRERLTPPEVVRLRAWAAGHGATESTALHAVWALLLYRAAAPAELADPVSVAFSAAVSGRGIALDGAELLSGTLRSSLPLSVRVRASMPVALLLEELSGHALDRAAYEWVSAGQIEEWTGRREGTADAPPLVESLVVFEPGTAASAAASAAALGAVVDELAEEGVRVTAPELVEGHAAVPFALVAHHDTEGGLVLTGGHDRARFEDTDAAALLAQAALLLSALPEGRAAPDVAGALELLDGAPVPQVRPRPPAPARILRPAARPGAGTICLLPPPGSPPGCYDGLPELYDGPQALATVGTLPDGQDPARCLRALRPSLARGEPVLLGGFSGAGGTARQAAERVAAHGWRPPPVAIAGAAEGGPGPLRTLARALTAAVRGPGFTSASPASPAHPASRDPSAPSAPSVPSVPTHQE